MLKQIETDETVPVTPVRAPTNLIPTVQAGPMTTPFVADLKDLTLRLVSRKVFVRTEAERQLRTMDVSTLLALMDYQRRLRKQRMVGIGVAFAIVIVLLLLLAFWMHSPIVFMFWSTATTMLVGAAAFTQAQKSGAMALAQMDDMNAVSELIAALEMRDEEVQRVVRPALTRLLPRLQAHDSPLLKEGGRRVLRQYMESSLYGRRFGRRQDPEAETQLLLAALKALEQVGDASFLPIVTQWAAGHKRGSDPRLRQAAAECLPYLEQCSTNRQVSSEMLRASAQDHSRDAEALLRPASDTHGASAENLLRPSEPD